MRIGVHLVKVDFSDDPKSVALTLAKGGCQPNPAP